VWECRRTLYGMQYLIAVPLIVFVVALIVGALTGRVKVGTCCAASDPRRDLRMRDAFPAESSPVGPQRQSVNDATNR
jgi:hypothetical protein